MEASDYLDKGAYSQERLEKMYADKRGSLRARLGHLSLKEKYELEMVALALKIRNPMGATRTKRCNRERQYQSLLHSLGNGSKVTSSFSVPTFPYRAPLMAGV